ncbi:MAG TPA: MvaI/BcnI family restriction endonuclease [Puia sp.]|nr:MvaI/BcnI family restriction endonuclease [Puia sp.]
MNLRELQKIFESKGCSKIYAKKLSPNDNSKNQVYLGGSFEILNVFPVSSIVTKPAGEWKRERFKAKMKFSWIAEDKNIYPAPNSQLILYPKYPEVRFSGFLSGCENAPSELMTQRLADRILFISVTKDGNVIGYVASPVSIIAEEFERLEIKEETGVFKVLDLPQNANNKDRLVEELKRIHLLGWINSKRFDAEKKILPCNSPNCGGYTLEAELGITPNGFSEPDYLGWEIKQFGVKDFNKLDSRVITLMTPEPTDGFYKTHGTEAFIHKYGYNDKKGREGRRNFGGIYKVSQWHKSTNLKLELIGFDKNSNKIRDTDGMIALIDKDERIAASWDFASLLLHWNRKHNQACFVPSKSVKEPERKYLYGNKAILGTGTDFQIFLKEMTKGNVYYDPGIKIESISFQPKIKRRSQFRIKSKEIRNLYRSSEIISF